MISRFNKKGAQNGGDYVAGGFACELYPAGGLRFSAAGGVSELRGLSEADGAGGTGDMRRFDAEYQQRNKCYDNKGGALMCMELQKPGRVWVPGRGGYRVFIDFRPIVRGRHKGKWEVEILPRRPKKIVVDLESIKEWPLYAEGGV